MTEQKIFCSQCKTLFSLNNCKYWIDNKFYIENNNTKIPFCDAACSLKYYKNNKYNNKTIITKFKK